MKKLYPTLIAALLIASGIIAVVRAQVQVTQGTSLVLASVAAPYTVGDIIAADSTTTFALISDAAVGNVLLSGGAGVAPAYGKVSLTAAVSGILPTANGGTGIAYFTAAGPSAARVYTFPDVASKVPTSPEILGSNTAPTVTSAGTSPSVTASNGTYAFRVNVGTGGVATTIVMAMPAATTGWNCHVNNLTASAANVADYKIVQTASTTTSVTVQQQTASTGVALAFTASDVVAFICIAY